MIRTVTVITAILLMLMLGGWLLQSALPSRPKMLPVSTVVDQGWDVKYRGQGVFRLSEKGRNLTGPPLAVLEDSYDLELDGNEVQVDGGPSDAPLRRVSGTSAPAAGRSAPAQSAPAKTKKKR